MRIGIVCPYSLTVPGGVQAQVLGLARELRRRGHEARVLGPCDGPPPEPFVTPLGDSLPLSANGSIAPLAPDPSAALRTLRVLADEQFDVIHLHEPLAPGPTSTALMVHSAPTVGTFHAAGTSASYRILGPALTRLIRRIDHKVVVSKDALALVHSHLGGEYEVLFNGVELDAIRSVAPWPRDIGRCRGSDPRCSSVAVTRNARGSECSSTRSWSADLQVDVWIGSDGPDTAELTAATAGDDRFHWLGRVTDDEKFARLRTADVFCCAVAARRVVRRGADRGDGGGHDRGGEFARRVPQRGHPRRRRAAGRAGRRRRARRRAAPGHDRRRPRPAAAPEPAIVAPNSSP